MSAQILLTALERIESHESGEHIAKHDRCEECKHMIEIAEKALAEYEAMENQTRLETKDDPTPGKYL